ncbi:DUF7146 domain-containing protein [Sphingomonas sanguinis]|uniref:Toprim domain-containing protein n=1 Tax=Sphingomonas sanguinis TaxID=33051 RepID=A0A7Y7QX67_9SPHN|nr:toprim domain-containing protein [Sphingomonas sanguinis]NNG48237.1 virulence-associated protein E [Sphingomonas sanguinis]NNG54983.1 virulence-associated protein E [Sphingomonas sanguinis]NVP32332.1 toprim domain-containing protein [Sphingomonas sanguinis]
MGITANRPSQHMVDLVGALGGTWLGYKAMCRCPAHADKTPSLSIRQGDRGLLVTCFAGCDAGDILRELDRIPLGRRYEPPTPVRATGTANIDRLWNEAIGISGTLAERYLASRHLLPAPNDVRFHPRCPHGPKPTTKFKPALLVGVREGLRLVAFQRIFLTGTGDGYTDKATLGLLGTGAWRGGDLGPTLGLAEGFESARAWSKMRGLPCWSSFGSRRLDLLTIPSSVTKLVLAADRDLPGRRAVARSIEQYASDALSVVPDYPPAPFKDWAEVLEAKERGGGGRR